MEIYLAANDSGVGFSRWVAVDFGFRVQCSSYTSEQTLDANPCSREGRGVISPPKGEGLAHNVHRNFTSLFSATVWPKTLQEENRGYR
jgi:hypothetical protein